jgi:hypothetical protein
MPFLRGKKNVTIMNFTSKTKTERPFLPPWITEGHFIILVIVLAGMGLRLFGIGFGLPYFSNFYIRPDETLIVVPGIRFFETLGDPGGFAYPALLKMLCGIIFQAYFQVSRLFHITTINNIVDHFILDPSQYFVVARSISVVIGSLTIFIVYKVAQKIFSRGTALLSALLIAVTPLSVRDSHFAVTDTLLSFLTTLCISITLSYIEAPLKRERRFLFMVSIVAGLALATKYSFLLLFPTVLLAILLKQMEFPRMMIIQISIMFCVAFLVFMAINPYVILRHMEALKDVGGTVLAIFNKPLSPHGWFIVSKIRQLLLVLSEGPGGVIGLQFFCLAFVLIKHDTKSLRIVAILVVSLLSLFTPAFLTYPLPYRYMTPALPLMAVFVAKGMTGVMALRLNKTLQISVVIIIGLVVCSSFFQSFQMSLILSRTDTRTLAWDWIRRHVPMSVPIVILGGPESEPQLFESSASLSHRIEYVHNLYGQKGGNITSELYRLQLRDKKRQTSGYRIVRNPARFAEKDVAYCIVIPSYPLPMIRIDQTWEKTATGKIINQVHIKGFRGEKNGFKLDEVDAFFLPFNRLDDVLNPGPNMDILFVQRG